MPTVDKHSERSYRNQNRRLNFQLKIWNFHPGLSDFQFRHPGLSVAGPGSFENEAKKDPGAKIFILRWDPGLLSEDPGPQLVPTSRKI